MWPKFEIPEVHAHKVPSAPPCEQIFSGVKATIMHQKWVKLNVGGTTIETTVQTLRKLGSKVIEVMLCETPEDGVVKIDQDPQVFNVLLNYARTDVLEAPRDKVTPGQLVTMAECLQFSQPIKQAVREYANMVTKRQKQQRIQQALVNQVTHPMSYRDADDMDDRMMRLMHHNQINISKTYIPRSCPNKKFCHRVDIMCCLDSNHADGQYDISNDVKGSESKDFIYEYELENLKVECIQCRKQLDLQPNLGWCHKCKCCCTCQDSFCASPESFKKC
ncbi:unnamed protein product [Owenia fusiformis]|uniref:Potassium channel tetramerisation-type BTB domain-containing protein n=1 Tax=Owenia fusiformis TaxID=6347 RepID=A0A8S4PUW7_OWEFU|nr:unnamed protein product [Owenia fusiformis]